MHLDNLLEELGGFGRYQIILAFVTALVRTAIVPSMLMMGFAGVEPDWWCVVDNQTHMTNESYKLCEMNGTCERIYTAEMSTIVSEWDLVCDLSWVTNTIISVQMAGMLLGGLIVGYCADVIGRKKTIYLGLFMLVVGNTVAAFSVSWVMFTVLRGLIGFSMALTFGPVYLYQVEYVGKRWRVTMAALPDWPIAFATHNTSARIGGVLAAQILSLGGNDDLMAPFIAMGVLSFLILASCLLLDETKDLPLQDTMKSTSGPE